MSLSMEQKPGRMKKVNVMNLIAQPEISVNDAVIVESEPTAAARIVCQLILG